MEYFGPLLNAVVGIMQIPFTIGGFTFSMWQVFLFGIVAGIVGWILWELFG